jgi:carnitine O-palmitoyltransferase 2
VERDKANLETSYINQWWFDLYVTDRRPLPLNFTPQLTFIDDPVEEKNQQAQRAANFVASSVSEQLYVQG